MILIKFNSEEKMKNQCSIIYNTCDKYECLWNGFFKLLDKYWNSCELKIILNTEEKSFSYGNFNIERPMHLNVGLSWSQRIVNSLNSITTPYVIMTLDDFWLKDSVDVLELQHCIDLMDSDKKIKCINFAPQPPPNKEFRDEKKYEKRGRFATYRINAQIAIWRVDYLKNIMRSYENPWQFELSGSFRSVIKGGTLLSIKRGERSPFVYDHGFLVVRGMINKELAEYFLKNENINVNFPFKEYNPEEYYDNKSGKFKRILGYFRDAIISLFRK